MVAADLARVTEIQLERKKASDRLTGTTPPPPLGLSVYIDPCELL